VTGLKPKRITLYRPVWHKIKANGFDVIPLLEGKAHPLPGWPTMPNEAADIERWNGRAAAIRMYGSGLVVIDIDVRIAAVVDEIVAMLTARWPDFMARCLRRHSGAAKLALIGRAETERHYLNTRRWVVPGTVPKTPEAKGHRVEVFTTLSRRYVGVHGLHSITDGVERHYGYHGATILDAQAAELPTFPGADLSPLMDACDAIMEAHGLVAVKPIHDGASGPVVYDIDDATRFDVHNGPDQIDYNTLCDMAAADSELRVSGSFIDGSHDRTKCRVGDCYVARCVGVFDNEEATWHCPKSAAPTHVPEGFAERLAAVAELHGVEVAPDLPNWRERYENGTPRASLHNARLAIEAGRFTCSHDVFHNKMFIGRSEATPPREALPAFCGEVTDNRIALLRWWVSRTYGRDFTEKHIRDAVVAAALERAFNPVTAMLAEAEASWDGVARLDRMAVDHFGCDDTPYTRACVRKTMIAAVARARHPGCKFDTILVLESPEGWNKSTAWLVLAGGPENFSDESILGKASREAMEQLAGIWIHENAELAGLHKSDIDVVRAYASRAEDRARPAYGHFLVRQPRQSIEIGTTNSIEYLQAQNGNRRFWPIRLRRPIDIGRLRAERLQLWGEAAHLEAGGEGLTLPPELWPFAAIEQEARRVRDPWEPLLEAMTIRSRTPIAGAYPGYGIIEDAHGELRVSTVDIFRNVLEIDKVGNIEARHARRLADAMRALGWESKLFKTEGKVVRGYARPRAAAEVTGNR